MQTMHKGNKNRITCDNGTVGHLNSSSSTFSHIPGCLHTEPSTCNMHLVVSTQGEENTIHLPCHVANFSYSRQVTGYGGSTDV